jgi:RNA polymerase sigma-70 factor (ECF subfamily)
LLQLYIERFNRRDWEGLRELITADARIDVADRLSGQLVDSPYFSRYADSPVPWRMVAGEVDEEPAIIVLKRDEGAWASRSIIRP